MTSVYMKLSAAREKFHSLKLEKTGRNEFAKYNYFELGDFLIPALGVFREFDLCAVISFDKDVATMRIVNMVDNSEIVITSPMGSASLKGCHEVQNIGAVETYQRRYLWVAALEIVEHDALDATTGSKEVDKIRRFTSSGTNGPVEVSEARKLTIQLAASLAVSRFEKGERIEAYDEISGITDGEEKLYLWQLLKSKSTLRAYIKQRAQELREEEATA